MNSKKIKASLEAETLAEQYGIDLSKVKGSGPDGLITVEDVENYIKEHFFPKVKEVVPLRGIRKVIAERLSYSARNAVHVTEFMEVNVTRLREYREKLSRELGVKPSFTVLILKCVARALREYPLLNAVIEGNELKILEDINVNVAIDTPYGLLAPVIRHVDKKSVLELIKELNELVKKAKELKLKEKDYVGGTFTLTNLGMFGVDAFTPIINPPQVAILGIGRIYEKPVLKNEALTTEYYMMLSLSFDHRVVDGAPAARFLLKVKECLENPSEYIKC